MSAPLQKYPPFRWAIPAIVMMTGSLALAFAWSAGWLGGQPVSRSFVNTAKDYPLGLRRAHGKGMCFAGVFRPAEQASGLSTARVFSQPQVAVNGRFSIGSGNPLAADVSTKTLSMALLMATDDRQQWRLALNNQPYFVTSSAEGFLAMRQALAVDPATGMPDAQRKLTFLQQYPEAQKFLQQALLAPAPGGFAGVDFNGVNAFYLVAADGRRTAVRWTMAAREPFIALDEAQREQVSEHFLFEGLQRRLADGPLYWDLVLQLAQPGDAVDDPAQPWPEDRQRVIAGTLQVTALSGQEQGACRDVNYDPVIVPSGIELSKDPILAARSAAYTHSFNLRMRELGHGRAGDTGAKEQVQ